MWQIKIHPLVFQDDFKKVSSADQKLILEAVQRKLSLDPEHFGKPLKGDFKSFWRLRVGDFRVIYQIIKNEIVIIILKVGIRKDDQVYREFFHRIKKI